MYAALPSYIAKIARKVTMLYICKEKDNALHIRKRTMLYICKENYNAFYIYKALSFSLLYFAM